MILESLSTIIVWIAILDALTILSLGVACSFIYLLGYEARQFWDRIVPATSILVATSVAAGVVLLIGRWIAQHVN